MIRLVMKQPVALAISFFLCVFASFSHSGVLPEREFQYDSYIYILYLIVFVNLFMVSQGLGQANQRFFWDASAMEIGEP